ncbi:MAG: flavin reductase family protein [Lysobacterales bacterium]
MEDPPKGPVPTHQASSTAEATVPRHDFTSGEFRQAVGEFITGVTVVTTLGGDEPKGMTVNSFSSVSLEPPMVLWNVGQDAESYQSFMDNDAFTLHILHAGQQDLAALFATRGADKFSPTPWQPGSNGMPLLNDCLVGLECHVSHRFPGGDHTIIVGTVSRIHRGQSREPLAFHRGRLSPC